MLKYSLGVDISMKSFHATLCSIDSLQVVKVKSSHSFSNNMEGFKKLHQWIEKHYADQSIPLVIVMEATGVYYEQCAMFLFRQGYNVAIVLPNKAKKYLQAVGLKSKNDKIDSKGLARMAAEQSLELWQPMSDFFYQLRALTRQRQSLQEMKTVISNQLHSQEFSAFPSKVVIRQHNQILKNINAQIQVIDKAIKLHIEANAEVKERLANICTMKGVGILTAATVVAECNGFELFKNVRQLVSYAGYDIVENQSGNHRGKTKISKKGNSRIRRALHMPAFTTITHDITPFKNLYERTLQKHSIKMKSYVAVQKKMLIMIYTLWKINKSFEINYIKSTGKKELEMSSQGSFAEAE